MKYFLIAGEASGDLHGSHLIKSILSIDNSADFRFWGGDLMHASYPGLIKHYRDVTVMGFIEVVQQLGKIKRNLEQCKQDILDYKPDVVICIDYPGFNLRIAEFCSKNDIEVHYFIAPKVWAWKENRVKKLEKFVDLLILIFPFEIEYFKKWKVNAVYAGNPLLDELSIPQDKSDDKKKSIALLPGSRKQEISRTLPLMLEALEDEKEYEIIVAGAPGIDPTYYKQFLNNRCKIVFGKTYELLSGATAAIVCSGTATLETAVLKVPRICVYKAHPLSYFIAKLLVKIRFISLVNLCMNKEVIKELIQSDFNTKNIKVELNNILHNQAYRSEMMKNYELLRNNLGGSGASARAAQFIINKLA